jgi:hypothetical protein
MHQPVMATIGMVMALVVFAPAEGIAAGKRPHVIFYLTDDMGWLTRHAMAIHWSGLLTLTGFRLKEQKPSPRSTPS